MKRDLYRIPENIPRSTKKLDLSFNPIKRLSSHSFSNFPELQVLDLSSCEIHIIEDSAFEGLHHLSALILTGNPIQNLAPGAFSGLSNLQKLVAVEIKLEYLEDFPIGHLRTLKELNVAHNFIQSFQLPDYFSNLPNLENLDLSNNRIQHIYHKDLKVLHQTPLPKLSLDVSRNILDFIQPGAFKEIKLRELIFRSNFRSNSIMKSCIQGLAGLQVDSLALGEFRNERMLDDFDISVLEGLHNLTFREVRIAYFRGDSEDIAEIFNYLENASDVSLVSLILTEFKKLPKDFKWQQLKFIHCKFEEFPELKLTSLKKLVFNFNSGKFMFPNVELTNLEYLDLSKNGINFRHCCSQKQFGASRLKYLDLSFNGLISMNSNFMGLEQLEYLDFQHSHLKQTNDFPIFLLLKNLTYLDISYTQIQVAFHGIFNGLASLQVLKMAGNSFLNNILPNIFMDLANLTFLDISNCQLEQVSPGAFDSVPRVQLLNLSGNNLLFLDTLPYKPLSALQVLDYSFNRIVASKQQELKPFPSNLTSLNLTQNDFACSCEHQTFLEWLKDQRKLLVNADQILCTSPFDMQGMPVLKFRNATCHMTHALIIALVVTGLVIVVVSVLIYKFYFHLMLFAGCKTYNRGESVYDAFVIYSSQDEDWVRNELVKNLEEGVPPFQLCLHYRDFIPGVAIAVNIIQEGFHKSRKVIVVVSKHFIQSRWCIFEYEIAQTWQFLSSHAGIIFIVLQKIEKSLLKQQVELYRLLSRNTYLEWEDSVISRHIFWRRLRKALLDGKTRVRDETEDAEDSQHEEKAPL